MYRKDEEGEIMDELRKPNGDYTETGLKYPGTKANIELCYKYLTELCRIVWTGNPNRPIEMTMWSIPPRPDDFDIQLSAAFDELKTYRDSGLSPERCVELAEMEKDGRLVVLPCKVGSNIWVVVDGVIRKHKISYCNIFRDGNIGFQADCWEADNNCDDNPCSINPVCGIKFLANNIDSMGVFFTRAEAEAAFGQQGGEEE